MHQLDLLDTEWCDALFEEAPTAMAVVDPEHRFVRCNDAYCRLVGYSRSEILARRWQSITHPDDVAGDQSGADAAKQDRNHSTYTIAKRYISKRGDVIWVNLHVRGIWRESGFQCYFVTAIQQLPARCEDCPGNGRRLAARETVLEWCKRNPKDAAVMLLAGVAFLGRDVVLEFLRVFLK